MGTLFIRFETSCSSPNVNRQFILHDAIFVADKDDICFLSRMGSEDFGKVFKAVRLQHILNDKPSLSTIEADKIIPEGENLVLTI